MSNRLWWATLNPRSPRYAEWREVLGSDEVPLQHPREQAMVLGEERTLGYVIGMQQLSTAQMDRLIAHVAAKFRRAPGEVLAEIISNGHFPIREEDVSVAFSMRAFL